MRYSALIVSAHIAMCLLQLEGIAQDVPLNLRSRILTPPVPFSESEAAIHRILLIGKIDKSGVGRALLSLNPNVPSFDSFGATKLDSNASALKLAVRIEFVRTGESKSESGLPTEKWHLYRLRGDELQTPILLATTSKDLISGRMLILGKDKKIKIVVDMQNPTPQGLPLPPCHPGCFPSGTLVLTPDGMKSIETIEVGSKVLTINDDGKSRIRKVKEVFVVTNQVLELQTEHGRLTTTDAQPLYIGKTKTKSAGELARNDKIYRWTNERIVESKIQSVQKQVQIVRVHNLVFDQTTLFVANGYVVRSKPPAGKEAVP